MANGSLGHCLLGPGGELGVRFWLMGQGAVGKYPTQKQQLDI